MSRIAEENAKMGATEPIIIKLSNDTYVIGSKNDDTEEHYNITLNLDEAHDMSGAEYDTNNLTHKLLEGHEMYHFSNGYLVLVEDEYRFTSYIYTMHSTVPFITKKSKDDVVISALLQTDKITMATHRHLTASFTLSEWNSLKNQDPEAIATAMLKNGKVVESYDSYEEASNIESHTSILVDGVEKKLPLNGTLFSRMNK